MTKCGKAYCACRSDPDKRHGPYFELTYKSEGKTVNVRLSPDAAPLYKTASTQFRMEPKAGRGGRSLLTGLLRCRRCGRMLHVAYSGTRRQVPRYHCRSAHINHGEAWCISFGGLRPDQAIAAEILKGVEDNAVEAAVEAAARIAEQRNQQRQALALELEQAQYEARLSARPYEAVDPDNRLAAAELEARWNAALRRVGEVESRLRQIEATVQGVSTRKVEAVLEQLGIAGVSAGQVSQLCAGLDEKARQFRERPLGKSRYVWVDALHEKVRVDDRVESMAMVLATGVNENERCEVIGVDLFPAGTELRKGPSRLCHWPIGRSVIFSNG